MTTATALIAVAARNVGYTEKPFGSNKTKFAAVAGQANGLAWCATFLIACARASGLTLPGESAYTPRFAQYFKEADRWHSTPKVGDFVFFNFIGRISHVGVVTFVGKGYILTIEGNTDEAGGRTGGKVMRKRRSSKIVGYGRPAYSAEPAKHVTHAAPGKVGPTLDMELAHFHTVATQVVQVAVGVRPDGEWGSKTQAAVIKYQKAHKLDPDGVVGPATWRVINA